MALHSHTAHTPFPVHVCPTIPIASGLFGRLARLLPAGMCRHRRESEPDQHDGENQRTEAGSGHQRTAISGIASPASAGTAWTVAKRLSSGYSAL